jgi:hypothetical protein
MYKELRCAAALPPLARTGENHELRCLFADNA